MKEYKAVFPAKTKILDIRGLRYAVHCWGSPENTPVFLLHGWADTGRSFQFLADEMANDFYLIAPDWRGFGDSQWASDGYWFPDYLADLDAIVDYFELDSKLRLVGHSMGGNIACLYAGSRPELVTQLVSLDVYGLPATEAEMAPARYRLWMNQLKTDYSFSRYDDMEKLVEHISKLAPGISREKAAFIALSWSRDPQAGESLFLKADPAHKRVNPVLYRRDEARGCWMSIEAQTMFIYGKDSRMYESYINDGYRDEFAECISQFSDAFIDGAGHMLHMQTPAELASHLKAFLKK